MSKQGVCMPDLILKKLFVFSPKSIKYFFTDFDEHINIVHGRNTSGKSTFLQSILYSMGINASNENLAEILKEKLIFRLDCNLIEKNQSKNLIFVRSDDTLVIKIDNKLPRRFDGINSNNSYEYARYKELFEELFGFNLKVQKQTELVKAPLEAAFLPYYISQAVGWIYIRESIGDYRFYKDFKFDYLDYYTGLSSGEDRLKKYKFEKEKESFEFEIKQLKNYKASSPELKLSDAINKRFKNRSIEYLEEYAALNNELISEEAKHSKLCNNLAMLRGRQRVLNQVIKNINNQKPKVDRCPTCDQILPGDIKELYLYTQDINDALKEQKKVSDQIKDISSKINSSEKKVLSIKEKYNKEYKTFRKFNVELTSFDSWIDNQANNKLLINISTKIKEAENEVCRIKIKLSELGIDENIDNERKKIEKLFLKILKKKAEALNVNIPESQKYRELYSISFFPFQGVELHKMIMAYHFAFNELIWRNPQLHKFPFILDAIFKEDIDTKNRDAIFSFISSETQSNTQVIFTVAEYKRETGSDIPNSLFNIKDVNKNFFSNRAKLICIGDAVSERAFLSKTNFQDEEYLNNTYELLETL